MVTLNQDMVQALSSLTCTILAQLHQWADIDKWLVCPSIATNVINLWFFVDKTRAVMFDESHMALPYRERGTHTVCISECVMSFSAALHGPWAIAETLLKV